MSRVVAILGAGAGGLTTAAHLRELLPDSDRVVVVDRHDQSHQGLSLLWVLRGWRTPDEVTARPDLAARGIELLQAEVESIDLESRRLRTSRGELGYDALVIALGAGLDPAALPGLPEALATGAAGEFYTMDGAVRLHERLAGLTGGRVCVAVTGIPFRCPAAPYEGAMLVADLLAEQGARDAVEIEMYTPEPLPMPVAGPVVGKALSGMLAQQGIALHTERPVARVDAGARELVLGDGQRVGYDVLVAIPPHRPPAPVAQAKLSEAGWVPVDASTLRTATEGVWALGDVSSITLHNGKPLPKAAVFAKRQAEVVAAGVARHLGQPAPDAVFDGHGHCFVEIGGGRAAKGQGKFLEPGGPTVELFEPSAAAHAEKEAEEREWLDAWRPST